MTAIAPRDRELTGPPVIPDPTHQPTLDVAYAAQLLGVGKNTAYEAIKAGEFPVKTFGVGRRIRVVTADLLRVLELDQPAQRDEVPAAQPGPPHTPAQHLSDAIDQERAIHVLPRA